MTIRNSDLSALRNRVRAKVNDVGTERQIEVWNLFWEDGATIEETADIMGVSENTVGQFTSQLRKRVIAAFPRVDPKYKGATRIINMLATECERKDSHHDNVSWQEIETHTKDIVDNHGTDNQRILFGHYFVDGLTQVKVAETMGVIQPTVYKSLMGNYDYRYGKFYGGIISKVGKHLRARNVPYCCSLVDTHGRLLSFLYKTYRN